MEPKSKAERLVLSFPATAENYPKAIDQLKERFGREDLLVQIYIVNMPSSVVPENKALNTKLFMQSYVNKWVHVNLRTPLEYKGRFVLFDDSMNIQLELAEEYFEGKFLNRYDKISVNQCHARVIRRLNSSEISSIIRNWQAC
ncbi:hypothetical protein TNCV_3510341 [Trichonephila clavipes]|nr:hypothetical protein TNCV_3510341 [Trichonephila clavipes]